MSTIRRQSILSSVVVYFGFALGFFNTYLLTREGGFTQEQYGLMGLFISLGNIMFAVSSMGMQSYIYKFYPYYKDRLKPAENDMMTWSFLISVIGFLFVMLGGFVFKDLVIRKYGTNSPDLVTYYKWVFPLGFGLTIFSILEAFAWQLRKSVLTNFLREFLFRFFTTVLIVLSSWGVIKNFDLFIKLFALLYLVLVLILGGYLYFIGQLRFTLKISKVSRRFFEKIRSLALFIWSGNLIFTISNQFDTLVIAAAMEKGIGFVAIYTLAQNIASLIQAPQRGIISSSVAALSEAWKNKDKEKIQRIYHRSSINQIIFASGMFVLIWINFTDAVYTFHLQKNYLAAMQVFLYIGFMRLIDMGTGVNSQIIGTSTFWRFDFITGIVLLGITLPFNYLLTKKLGVTDPAIAILAALTIYNLIRFLYLYRKMGLQPFNWKSLYTLLLAVGGFFVCYNLFNDKQGFGWIVGRSVVFLILFIPGLILLKVSPDIIPVWNTILKKVRIRNKE